MDNSIHAEDVSSLSIAGPSIPDVQKPLPVSKTPTRSSSVRFSLTEEPEEIEHTSMPTAQDDVPDEGTPIRTADEQGARSYDATTTDSSPNIIRRQEVVDTPHSSATTEEKTPWYKKIAEKYGSITLENKGSVARDHLALERTFLAWLRTSLAFASIGIAVTQLFRLNTSLQNHTRSLQASLGQHPYTPTLPLSPLLGHGLPAELVPYLQQLVASAQYTETPLMRGSTLLDQLLLAPATRDQADVCASGHQLSDHAAAKLRSIGKPLGATFIGISIVVLFVGFHRYFEAQYWVIKGKFPASRGSVALVGLLAGTLMIASLIVVLVITPVVHEK